jgi:hypothetical protein
MCKTILVLVFIVLGVGYRANLAHAWDCSTAATDDTSCWRKK